jgi:hypothetical protein
LAAVKSLIYDVYRHGHAGLSNLIMSIEVGVVLSRLTDRLLVLRGNKVPFANVVRYGDTVRNTYPSRVTDLIELGVPWTDAENVDLAAFAVHELCDQPSWDCVCYFPSWLSTESTDILAFAGERKTFITVQEELQDVPALSFSGGPKHHTLSFYSYFFYLDRSAQLLGLDALRRTRPKAPYAELAQRVANDIGPFNAVHVRRGDFKMTTGVTTLDRKPEEVVEALDQQFDRGDLLVVLTDEADDPFLLPLKAAFKKHLLIDRHVLADYGRDFSDLPAHDSIALAYLSQLIAAHSRDFIGSMRSTFTSLIQRMRGNHGKDERFKFLWNELPDPGDVLEPGRHPISDCIRLEKGVMVPEREGPYSWNRHHPRLNPAWMREWPESFLNEAEMVARAADRVLADKPPAAPAIAAATPQADADNLPGGGDFVICLLDHCVSASSNRQGIAAAMRHLFRPMISPYRAQSGGEVRVAVFGDQVEVLSDGRVVSESSLGSNYLRAFYRQIVCHFVDRLPRLVWLHAGAAAFADGAVVLPGEWARGKSSLVMELSRRGWSFLSDDIAPLDVSAGTVVPFPTTPQIRFNVDKRLRREELGGFAKQASPLEPESVAKTPAPLSMIVFPHYATDAESRLAPVPPAEAVGKLIENCISFVQNEDAVIRRLCAIAEALPIYSLRFGDVRSAADLLIQTYHQRRHAMKQTPEGVAFR